MKKMTAVLTLMFTALVPALAEESSATNPLVKFLDTNTLDDGMPLSYRAPKGYWKSINSSPDKVEDIVERLLVGEEGFSEAGAVNIYDAAVWQIVMAVTGHTKQADRWTERLLSGSSGELSSIRATAQYFTYNGQKLDADQSYFFRMFGNRYMMSDPLNGNDTFEGFPNMSRLHHEDWKPITGENAWAAIIGPLQVAYLRTHGNIDPHSPEVRLALSVLPAFKAMQSPIGAVYHAPEGTFEKDPRDISTENNLSVYAALRMLREVTKQNKDKDLTAEITNMMEKIEEYFKVYAFNKEEGIFYQGGLYVDGEFKPSKDFAVDCQTWGAAVLGSDWIDKQFGEGAAYKMWQKTKEHSGYFKDRVLQGVGFTDSHDILSSDWTFGAILMARLLSSQYQTSHPGWSEAFAKDAEAMREGMETLRVEWPDGSAAYRYSNKRYYIVFGWWANPIPSTASSAWAFMDDQGFDPFVLGGKAAELTFSPKAATP